MEKKDLKMYEAPAVEVVEMEVAGVILAGSGESNADNVTGGTPGEVEDLW